MTTALRVIKVGGRAQEDPALARALAAAWRAAPASLCVVHGGGGELSALQRRLGGEPRFVGGRRVTSAADIELARMALSGAANKRLVARLVALGVPATGLSGEDAGLLTAEPFDSGALGLVGGAPRADATLLRHLLAGGYLPVVSPLGRPRAASDASDPGRAADEALNVNGDDAAAAIAVALGAAELLLLSDVPGVLDGRRPVATLDPDRAAALVAGGTAVGGMAAKLEAALAALEGGVPRVRIGDAALLDDAGAGTTLARAVALL
ncbi:MAG TPA: acetylglutamate kinase [Gemmatimonadaceae bacterium]|nr:acetylglutamate kinase [Gemmatimonadaceae bacterium]